MGFSHLDCGSTDRRLAGWTGQWLRRAGGHEISVLAGRKGVFTSLQNTS